MLFKSWLGAQEAEADAVLCGGRSPSTQTARQSFKANPEMSPVARSEASSSRPAAYVRLLHFDFVRFIL